MIPITFKICVEDFCETCNSEQAFCMCCAKCNKPFCPCKEANNKRALEEEYRKARMPKPGDRDPRPYDPKTSKYGKYVLYPGRKSWVWEKQTKEEYYQRIPPFTTDKEKAKKYWEGLNHFVNESNCGRTD